jgi:hypothetical protein
MLQTKFLEKNQDTHLVFNVFFVSYAFYEIKWKKKMYSRTGHGWQYGACELHAECLSYKYTLRLCNNYCFSKKTLVVQTGHSVMSYALCLSRVFSNYVIISENTTSNGTFVIQYRIGKDAEGSVRDTIWLPSRNWPGGTEDWLHCNTTSKVTAWHIQMTSVNHGAMQHTLGITQRQG